MFNGDFLIWGGPGGAVCGTLYGNFASERSIDRLCFPAKFHHLVDLMEFLGVSSHCDHLGGAVGDGSNDLMMKSLVL